MIPVIASGFNQGRIDRAALAAALGWTSAEIYQARDAWRQLHRRQPGSTLTFERYIDMMTEAALRPSMIGLHAGQYNLARYGDQGAYTEGNCRFIKREANDAERSFAFIATPEFRRAASIAALKRARLPCPNCGRSFTAGMLSRWHGDRCRAGA